MYYKCTLVTTGQKHQNYWARIGYYWDFCPVVKQLKYALGYTSRLTASKSVKLFSSGGGLSANVGSSFKTV
jgi:hypothetical protein